MSIRARYCVLEQMKFFSLIFRVLSTELWHVLCSDRPYSPRSIP